MFGIEAEDEPRALTREEMQKEFLSILKGYANYWANLPDKTPQERCEGMAFSMLCMLDGVSMGLPAFNVYPAPHPSDKQFHIDEGENCWDEEVDLHGDCYLHDMFYKE